MPIIIEYCEDGGVLLKYKLDEYYSPYLKTFLTSLASTGLLEKCKITTSPNEAFYHFEFSANSICTLKEFLGSPLSSGYDSSSSSSSYSSLEFSSDDEEGDRCDVDGESDVMFSYNQSLMLIGCLSTQLSALRRNRLTFFKLSLNDVFVVNRNVFLMVNPDAVLPMKGGGAITIMKALRFDSSTFCCPEIVNRKTFPFHCPGSCIYYCFAPLIYYCMFNDYLPIVGDEQVLKGLKIVNGLKEIDGREERDERDVSEEVDSGEEVDESDEDIGFERVNEGFYGSKGVSKDGSESGSEGGSESGSDCFLEQERMISRLKGTKLYFFLKRCLEPMGEKRRLFLI